MVCCNVTYILVSHHSCQSPSRPTAHTINITIVIFSSCPFRPLLHSSWSWMYQITYSFVFMHRHMRKHTHLITHMLHRKPMYTCTHIVICHTTSKSYDEKTFSSRCMDALVKHTVKYDCVCQIQSNMCMRVCKTKTHMYECSHYAHSCMCIYDTNHM